MRKLNAGIALGLVVALIGAALVLAYGRHVNQKIADGRRTVPVLVADTTIPTGTAVSALAGHVHVAQVPVAYLVADPVSSLGSLTGSTGTTAGAGLVTLGPVAQGTQLSQTLFGAPTSAAVVKPARGHVALALQAGLSPGVAHYITPGSYVDVFVTYTGAGAGAAGQQVADRTKMFMSAVKVLSVSVAQDPAAKTSSASPATNAAVGNNVITVLDVTPAAAEKLVNATTLGSIYLALSSKTPQVTPAGAVPLDVVTSNR